MDTEYAVPCMISCSNRLANHPFQPAEPRLKFGSGTALGSLRNEFWIPSYLSSSPRRNISAIQPCVLAVVLAHVLAGAAHALGGDQKMQ